MFWFAFLYEKFEHFFGVFLVIYIHVLSFLLYNVRLISLNDFCTTAALHSEKYTRKSMHKSQFLIFAILITMCLGEDFFGFILFGTHCTSWTWISVFFPRLVKFSAINIIPSNKFSSPFFLFSLWTPTMPVLVCLMLS